MPLRQHSTLEYLLSLKWHLTNDMNTPCLVFPSTADSSAHMVKPLFFKNRMDNGSGRTGHAAVGYLETAKEKATFISECGLYLSRRRPTLPHTFACSTIGPAGLNFRVRDGNGWIPRGKITDNRRRLRSFSATPKS